MIKKLLRPKFLDEEDFIFDLIFENEIETNKVFDKIDYLVLTKIASSNLFIPSLYSLMKQRKFLKYVPKDFKNYIKSIFSQNKKRNRILLNEIKFLAEIFTNNEIEHVFIKGSANLISKIYSDYGERMVGDIDFLIKEKDILKTLKLLNSNGYFSKYPEVSKDSFRHLPRMNNKRKCFAIEPHVNIVNDYYELINSDSIFKNKVEINDIYVPKMEDNFYINIYNIMINDRSVYTLNYNYRNIYDYSLIDKKIDSKIIFSSDILSSYLKIFAELKILKKYNENLRLNFINKLRFLLKRRYLSLRKIDNFLCKVFIKFKRVST